MPDLLQRIGVELYRHAHIPKTHNPIGTELGTAEQLGKQKVRPRTDIEIH